MNERKKIFLMFPKEKIRNIFFGFLLALALLLPEISCRAQGESAPPPSEIHALSAVLMDGGSGRVLYDKEGEKRRANASTTKIMTCILALENCAEDEIALVSDYAATMPNVKLGVRAGERYYLRDLLYSLMLESHNDAAVVIAEHVAGSVPAFAEKMNEKAAQLGCTDTHFITPNGLDASDDQGFHGTTAADLARIMAYCAWYSPQSARFLELTRTMSYEFSDLILQQDGSAAPGSRRFLCGNKNAYLSQDGECITGKTGFTGDAGYCYVAAADSGGRRFVVALLASGWPNNKTYKWQDCRRLLDYGRANYHIREVPQFTEELQKITITDSANPQWDLEAEQTAAPYTDETDVSVLMADWETIRADVSYPKQLRAGRKGKKTVGTITVTLEDRPLLTKKIYVDLPDERRNLSWYFQAVLRHWSRFSPETEGFFERLKI